MRLGWWPLLACAALVHPGCAIPAARAGQPPAPAARNPPSPYGLVDLWALSAPESVARSVPSLARFLGQPEFSEKEKARAIFRWVAANLRYDLQAFSSGALEEAQPGEVLRRRSAVCEGYAGLFEALAREAGLHAVTVRGFAKGAGYAPGRAVPSRFNHAWNAVLASGRWMLLDCTWASGVLTEDGGYDATFDSYFFDVPPQELILTHFPADPRWQMLAAPMTWEDFEDLPYVKTPFFKCGLALGNPRTWKLDESGPLFRVTLRAPERTSLLASLVRGDVEMREGRIAILRDDGSATIWALAPEAGEYTLRVFASRGDPQGIHHWAADFVAVSASGEPGGTVEEALANAGVQAPGRRSRRRG